MFNSSAIRNNRIVIIYFYFGVFTGCRLHLHLNSTFKIGNCREVLDSFMSVRAGILICLIYYPFFLGGVLNEDGYFPFSGIIFIVDKYTIMIAVQTSNTHILVPSLNVFGMYTLQR
jgi:hypothetical protein